MRVKDPTEIRLWRKQKRFSQRDLAALCRCSQSTINAIEAGHLRNLTENLAMQIASRLEVPWEKLFEARDAVPLPLVTTDAGSTRRQASAA